MTNPENREPEDDKKVEIVLIEQLIPGIKDSPTEEIDYGTNRFGDSFMPEFLKALRALTSSRERLEILTKRFRDQVIVDLGPGDYGEGYFLAASLGAKGYVGVEKFRQNMLEKNLKSVTKESNNRYAESLHYFEAREGNIKPESDLIPASIVGEDMLSFLKRLPDNSVSILTSGIDSNIIPNEKYRREVASEIQRVLNKNGVYMTCASDIPVKGLESMGNALESEQINDRQKSLFNLSGRSQLLIKK